MEGKIQKIKEIIANKLGTPLEKIEPDSDLVEDFNAEFLEIADIIMEINQEFSIEISDEEIKKIKTVNDIINLVSEAE